MDRERMKNLRNWLRVTKMADEHLNNHFEDEHVSKFCTYYRRFIEDASTIAGCLTMLRNMNQPFST